MAYVYSIVFKRYAPFGSFGGGFHGDGRTTPQWLGTARVHAQVGFDFDVGVKSWHAWSSPTYHTAKPNYKVTSKPSIKMLSQSCSSGCVNFKAQSAGSNPMTPGAPDIDTFVSVEITEKQVTGKVTGDPFPNCEVFLTRRQVVASSQPTMTGVDVQLLFDFRTPHGPNKGPFTKLFGAHEKTVLGSFSEKICW